jgi:hypothetical protein
VRPANDNLRRVVRFAVSAVGRDRSGIVAAIVGGSCSILRGKSYGAWAVSRSTSSAASPSRTRWPPGRIG